MMLSKNQRSLKGLKSQCSEEKNWVGVEISKIMIVV